MLRIVLEHTEVHVRLEAMDRLFEEGSTITEEEDGESLQAALLQRVCVDDDLAAACKASTVLDKLGVLT